MCSLCLGSSCVELLGQFNIPEKGLIDAPTILAINAVPFDSFWDIIISKRNAAPNAKPLTWRHQAFGGARQDSWSSTLPSVLHGAASP